MKIWCDLRLLYDETAYARFVNEFLKDFVSQKKEHTFFLYSYIPLDINWGNVVSRIVKEKRDWFWSELKFSKELKNDKLDIFLSFDENKPYFYKWKTILFIPSLAHVFYTDEGFSFAKSWEQFTYQKNLKSAHKIVCFDEATKDDLNERFNIIEDTITVMRPFFVLDDMIEPSDIVQIDIKARHNLSMDYCIYNAWYWVDKNLERLVEVFARLKEAGKDLALFVFWGEEVGTDLEVRKVVLQFDINDRIFFHSNIKKEEEGYFFKQSLWVIYPVLYESFPFTLNKALFYNIPIIASHISSVKTIFDGKIDYFNPVSKVDMTKSIIEFTRKNIHVDYSSITATYSRSSFSAALENMLK